jgi:hypothetical protein
VGYTVVVCLPDSECDECSLTTLPEALAQSDAIFDKLNADGIPDFTVLVRNSIRIVSRVEKYTIRKAASS